MKKKIIFLPIFLIIVIAITGKILFNENINRPIEVSVEAGDDINASLKTEIEAKKDIIVHVKGNVKNPGVYTLKEGDRVIDAVEKAGGPDEEADMDGLNLASILVDGQAVYIPSENDLSNKNHAYDGMININTCTKNQLVNLPGIGDTIAEEIINYRNTNGYFTTIEEIKKVKRIGEKTFENIKDKITVN